MGLGNAIGIGIPMVSLGLGGGASGPSDGILTENGEFILTEANGDFIITEPQLP